MLLLLIDERLVEGLKQAMLGEWRIEDDVDAGKVLPENRYKLRVGTPDLLSQAAREQFF